MKSTTSISLSDDVLAATKEWAASEHRPLSHHIEMILGAALSRRSPKSPKPRARKVANRKEAAHV